jgi:hypothetical protein
MQYFDEAVRTVCDDSCVRVDHSSYAARPASIGSKVLVRIYGVTSFPVQNAGLAPEG